MRNQKSLSTRKSPSGERADVCKCRGLCVANNKKYYILNMCGWQNKKKKDDKHDIENGASDF